MKWMLMLMVLLGGVSCGKKEAGKKEAGKTPDTSRHSQAKAREAASESLEQKRALNEQKRDADVAAFFETMKNSRSSNKDRIGPLAGLDEGTIVADLKKRLESSAPKPGSENCQKVEEALAELLKRKSAEFYTMLSLLPPGDYSEMAVDSVFGDAGLELDEFREVMAKIQEPDLAKAALNGAFKHAQDWKVGIAELESFEKLGLDELRFGSVLVEGYKSGLYSLEEVAKNSTDTNNAVYNRLREVLSYPQTKEYFELVYKNGRKVDSSSLRVTGYQLFQDQGQDAVAWARQLPEEAGKQVAAGIFSEWTSADPRAASKYLAEMDEGILKDGSALGLVRNCAAHGNQEEAAGWAAQIKDEKMRAEAQGLIEKKTSVR